MEETVMEVSKDTNQFNSSTKESVLLLILTSPKKQAAACISSAHNNETAVSLSTSLGKAIR